MYIYTLRTVHVSIVNKRSYTYRDPIYFHVSLIIYTLLQRVHLLHYVHLEPNLHI